MENKGTGTATKGGESERKTVYKQCKKSGGEDINVRGNGPRRKEHHRYDLPFTFTEED